MKILVVDGDRPIVRTACDIPNIKGGRIMKLRNAPVAVQAGKP